jgi:predicted anti-sigma-YlaC factor YlaD
MLSCKQLTELATDYLEKNLPWRERLRIRLHLWMCIYCRSYMDQMRRVIELLRRLPTDPVPPNLVETLLPQFREALGKKA